MKSTLPFIGLTVVTLVIGAAIGYSVGYDHGWEKSVGRMNISNFEECAAAGNPVMESYPRQCRSQDGRLFVEDVNAKGGCVIGGCSSQLCGEADGGPLISTCEFRPEYSCYQSAVCERQADQKCGWTQTATLTACLKNPPPLE